VISIEQISAINTPLGNLSNGRVHEQGMVHCVQVFCQTLPYCIVRYFHSVCDEQACGAFCFTAQISDLHSFVLSSLVVLATEIQSATLEATICLIGKCFNNWEVLCILRVEAA